MSTQKIGLSPFVRSPYNYDRDLASDEAGLECKDESLTKQSFKEECDINTIVRNFGLTGELPDVRAPQYGDFTGITDFHSALNAVAEANEAFDALPAEVRFRFHNDPQQLLEFCADDKNYDEAVKLGIAMPAKQEEPVLPVVAVNEPPKAADTLVP